LNSIAFFYVRSKCTCVSLCILTPGAWCTAWCANTRSRRGVLPRRLILNIPPMRVQR